MIAALQYKKNRPYLHTLVFVLLVSWVFLTISSTCSMPSVLIETSDRMPGCSESGTTGHPLHQGQVPKVMQDCSFKPCIDSQPDSFTDFKRLTKSDMPVFILGLMWSSLYWFQSSPPSQVPLKFDPPQGRRIRLIYWFCTLLN